MALTWAGCALRFVIEGVRVCRRGTIESVFYPSLAACGLDNLRPRHVLSLAGCHGSVKKCAFVLGRLFVAGNTTQPEGVVVVCLVDRQG